MRHESWITVAALCGLLVAAQSSSAQILSAGQEARILQRFPQADRDGDGKLSAEELAPLREQLEKWRAKQNEAKSKEGKQPKAKPKGPAPTSDRTSRSMMSSGLENLRPLPDSAVRW